MSFFFGSPDIPELPPPPEIKESEFDALRRRRLSAAGKGGLSSRIFTSPLGDTSTTSTKKNLLGE